ncbi:MAG: translation initiation factor [Nitrospira sp. CG24A]|nr:MAG: translation initiation factor [Nitrospira sp. CG24A]
MEKKKRIPTSGEPAPWASPFAYLQNIELPPTPRERQDISNLAQTDSKQAASKKPRGRVNIVRQTAHRGGKTVTVISGFLGISLTEKEALAKKMQQSCGAGGTVKKGRIEVQGDQRETVARILTSAGFRPVFAGG